MITHLLDHSNRIFRALAVVLVIALTLVWLTGRPADAVASGAAGYAWGDFDGDGQGDLAIGIPGEDIGRHGQAGAVSVLYGGGSGLSASGDDTWHQGVADVDGQPENGDSFGSALATGDFDGDGFDDLAIGAPGEGVSGASAAGAVHILYGTDGEGLRTSNAQLILQGSVGIGGNPENGDRFGFALSGGDLDGDGVSDLAIGAPGEGVNGRDNAGAVQTLYGTTIGGLAGAGGETITQDSAGINGTAEAGDTFGFSLASGDFDGDINRPQSEREDDLAISAPFEDLSGKDQAGAVYSVSGTATGLDPTRSHVMTQDTVFADSEVGSGDKFGYALAVGNFDPADDEVSGPFDDLAIGAPGDLDCGCGSVSVVRGTDVGFQDVADLWYQGKGGETAGAVPGTRESGDEFGYALAANDFDGNAAADLAIGSPGEDLGSSRDDGTVTVMYSDSLNLDPSFGPAELWSQNSAGVGGRSERGDRFGAMLGSGDYNEDEADDLTIGAPSEDIGSKPNAGMVTVLYGTDETLTGSGSDSWHQDIRGIGGTAERNDFYGGSSA